MEDMTHCRVHPERPAEYICSVCKNGSLCEECKQNHEDGVMHALDNFKEVGLAIMHQRVQNAGGILAKELAKKLTEKLMVVVKELETGFLREINAFESSFVNSDEQCLWMQELDREGNYVELYFYAKSLPAGGVRNETAIGELNKRLFKTFNAASVGLKKVLSDLTVIQHKPIFSAYRKDEVFMLKGESYQKEENVISALHSADMSKFKAVYIDLWDSVGDRTISELASCLQAHPVSALRLAGCNISDDGAKQLARAVLKNKSLSALCIVSQKISDAGAKALAEAARNSRSLTAFYLIGHEITDSGAIAVAEAVKECPLSIFYLLSDHISDIGATAVAEAVKNCPISAFCIWGNGISNRGATAVAKAMKDSLLSVLFLAGDEISDSGAVDAVEILSSGGCASTLSAFLLWGFDISDIGVRKIADAVRDYPLLSELYIDCRPITGEALAYILKDMANINTIRSVNLRISDIHRKQMDSCLNRLRQSGVAEQLKLRFRCSTETVKNVCNKFAAEWSGVFAEFRTVTRIADLFMVELILGAPK